MKTGYIPVNPPGRRAGGTAVKATAAMKDDFG